MAVRSFVTLTKALGDESRLRVLMALRGAEELCLCQLIDVLGLAPSTVSKHLNLLRAAELVDRRKDGRWHYYRLADEGAPTEVRQALEWVANALQDEPQIVHDAEQVQLQSCRDRSELAECYRS